MNIAFIGLGNMGAPMALNLLKAGHNVTGFDTFATPEGIDLAATAGEAAASADVVITMLPNGAILRAVASEVIPAMKPGAVLCDCSTVDVDSAKAVAEQAVAAGLGALDAPVSGGVGGAAAGTLTFMVGGSDEAFATVQPLFEIMGQKAVHCGASGAGQAAKICNNMILGVTMIATCEAFALADKLGLNRQKMYDVVSTSSGYSWTMNAYTPAPGVGAKSPADNGYKPGFAAELMLKDLGLATEAARVAHQPVVMGAVAQQLYQAMSLRGDGGKDFGRQAVPAGGRQRPGTGAGTTVPRPGRRRARASPAPGRGRGRRRRRPFGAPRARAPQCRPPVRGTPNRGGPDRGACRRGP